MNVERAKRAAWLRDEASGCANPDGGSRDCLHGVSVVICSHNGAQRLPRALAHLAAQQVSVSIPWEVIVVDNASTDATGEIAGRLWAAAPAPLRVVSEPRLGLGHARERGLDEARYECVSFIDDDNWIGPEWVATVAGIMSQCPDVGGCFGFKEGVCEVPPPSWFERLKWRYVVGPEITQPCDFSDRPCEVPGAGLTIRKSAWRQLRSSGFKLYATGHQGSRLYAGEDSELCCALRFGGWRLWYDPSLRLQHFIAAERLTWAYLRRQAHDWGMSTPLLDPYYIELAKLGIGADGNGGESRGWLRESWGWHLLAAIKKLLGSLVTELRYCVFTYEGEERQLVIDSAIGRLQGLLRFRRARGAALGSMRQRSWESSGRAAG